MTTRNHATGKREPDPYTKRRRALAAMRKVRNERRRREAQGKNEERP